MCLKSRMLLAAHKKYGGNVVVCHVLRYAPAVSNFLFLMKIKNRNRSVKNSQINIKG